MSPVDGDALVARLDTAGVRRAVVLSTAYIWEQGTRAVDDPSGKLRADNDWTSQQMARHRDRLIGFCGINPLKAYALAELARCAKDPNLRHGVKLHFGNSGVDYHNPQHVTLVRQVFHAANRHRMTIVVHMRASFSLNLPYGGEEARIFLREFVPAALTSSSRSRISLAAGRREMRYERSVQRAGRGGVAGRCDASDRSAPDPLGLRRRHRWQRPAGGVGGIPRPAADRRGTRNDRGERAALSPLTRINPHPAARCDR
jgi:hypothetical protein